MSHSGTKKVVVLALVTVVMSAAACVAQQPSGSVPPERDMAAGRRVPEIRPQSSPKDAAPTALILCTTGAPALEPVYDVWLESLAQAGALVTVTNSSTEFRSLYLANPYTFVLAVTDDKQFLALWEVEIPRAAQFCAAWLESGTEIGVLTRAAVLGPEQQVYPIAKQQQAAGGTDWWLPGFLKWLDGVLPCVNTCLDNFAKALPPNIHIELTIEFSSTPPGVKVTVKFSATGQEAVQAARAAFDLTRCIAGCNYR